MNQPTVTMAELLQQRTPNVKRSISTKSLHQDAWNSNSNLGMNNNPNLWNNISQVNGQNSIRNHPANDPRFNPGMMNPMMHVVQASQMPHALQMVPHGTTAGRHHPRAATAW